MNIGLNKGFIGEFRYKKTSENHNTRIVFVDCGRRLEAFYRFLYISVVIAIVVNDEQSELNKIDDKTYLINLPNIDLKADSINKVKIDVYFVTEQERQECGDYVN